MARTYQVKAFRGQRTCQYMVDDWNRCKQPRDVHSDTNRSPLDHPFTQTPLRCERCSDLIPIGTGYKWVKPRRHRAAAGRKRIRCLTCPGWTAAELTSSEVLRIIYEAQATIETAAYEGDVPTDPTDCEAFTEALTGLGDEFAEAIREAVDIRNDAADNIEEGFGHPTVQSDDLRAEGDQIEQWADEMESVTFGEFDPPDEDLDDDDVLTDYLADWAEEQRQTLLDAAGESPL